MTDQAERARLQASWTDALDAWAIPPSILETAPESPFGFPAELFVRRAQRSVEGAEDGELTPTSRAAMEALGEGGSVLDVGVGGGATSLPLAERCTGLVAVDSQADMLEAIARLATERSIPVTAVHGRWPDVAPETPDADVVVCGHVAYNAPDLGAFVTALSTHARRRVVLELTGRHPLSWMNDLWSRFHDVVRPERPTAADAFTLCRALGFAVEREQRVDTEDAAGGGFERRGDAVALVRRRLCLPAERDGEVAAALGSRLSELDGLWRAGPRDQPVVTLWWDV